MSNPVSLFVEEESACLSELTDDDVLGCERDPKLKDYLKGADSDSYTMQLSELFEARGDVLKFQPADRILRIFLWSWLEDETQICDMDPELAEELGLDLAIRSATLQKLRSEIESFSPAVVAKALFGPNDVWETEGELADYLGLWDSAFSSALKQGKGLYYKIWV